MTLEDQIVVLTADRENLHDRVRDLLAENTKLRERLGPLGLEVVEIDGAGHYVNAKVKTEIETLRSKLQTEMEITENLAWAIDNPRRP